MMVSQKSRWDARCLVCTVAATVIWTGIAKGQADPTLGGGFGSGLPPADMKTVIIELQHAQTDQIQQAIQTVIPSPGTFNFLRVAVNRNRLILRGSEEELKAAAELAEQLDQPIKSQQQTVTIDLNKFPGRSSEHVVEYAQTSLGLNVYQDSDLNFVVASGPPEDVERFSSIVEDLRNVMEKQVRLEAEHAQQKAEAEAAKNPRLLIRVAWLMALPTQSELAIEMPAVPEDLRSVAAELVNVGMAPKVDDIRLGTQLMVLAADGSFQTTGKLSNDYTVRLSGQLTAAADSRSRTLNVESFRVSRDSDDPKASDTFCEFSTIVTAPIGQTIILGMAPTEDMSSAAVIQIRPMISGEVGQQAESSKASSPESK